MASMPFWVNRIRVMYVGIGLAPFICREAPPSKRYSSPDEGRLRVDGSGPPKRGPVRVFLEPMHVQIGAALIPAFLRDRRRARVGVDLRLAGRALPRRGEGGLLRALLLDMRPGRRENAAHA